jgi:hypothetical protein
MPAYVPVGETVKVAGTAGGVRPTMATSWGMTPSLADLVEEAVESHRGGRGGAGLVNGGVPHAKIILQQMTGKYL